MYGSNLWTRSTEIGAMQSVAHSGICKRSQCTQGAPTIVVPASSGKHSMVSNEKSALRLGNTVRITHSQLLDAYLYVVWWMVW